MDDYRFDHHFRNSPMFQGGHDVQTTSDRRQTRSGKKRSNRQNYEHYEQRPPRSLRFDHNQDSAVIIEDDQLENTEDEESSENMGKDSGCANCVSVFNILLGMAILGVWIYSYVMSYTGKVIAINFAAGAWAGGLVILSGMCTFIYSCVSTRFMGICALSFNIFVIICTLACAGISAMDAFIEYRIYKDEAYVADSINLTYIKEELQKALDDNKINEKSSNEEFDYDGAILYGIMCLCSVLVTLLMIAWSCYFCVAEDDDDDNESENEDEYMNKRDNVSVRSPFTNNIPRGQVAEDYNYGRRNYQARQNWGFYDDDYSLQPSRNATGYSNGRYQPPLYDDDSPTIPVRGLGNRDRYGNGNPNELYLQRVPPNQQSRTNRKGKAYPKSDYSRQPPGIPRATSRYYAESVPEHRHYGRNQYAEQQRAYSIDGLAPYNQQRDRDQYSRRGDVNPDRSWMYSYY